MMENIPNTDVFNLGWIQDFRVGILRYILLKAIYPPQEVFKIEVLDNGILVWSF